MSRKLIAISGPTASGKSGWGIQLAQAVNGVIICADSRTVYRELNIGAGKVTTEYPTTWRQSPFGPVATVEGVDHYGLNLLGLDETFTVGQFQHYVYGLLSLLWSHGKQPILVGGTGLYVSAVIEGYTFGGRGHRVRQRPDFFSRVFVVNRPRQELYQRIDQRVDGRVAQGMVEEVRALIDQGWTERLKALGLEYRVLTKYLLGGESSEAQEAMVARLKGEIHAYARRQLTWWRHRSDVSWISSYTELEAKARQFLAT
ncbi:hypothetical protein HY374_03660 [Candidatus Berkelbacteria bacterium]|nr:hypothetical protein [Candidatus Berkelbacteria bacterium]